MKLTSVTVWSLALMFVGLTLIAIAQVGPALFGKEEAPENWHLMDLSWEEREKYMAAEIERLESDGVTDDDRGLYSLKLDWSTATTPEKVDFCQTWEEIPEAMLQVVTDRPYVSEELATDFIEEVCW